MTDERLAEADKIDRKALLAEVRCIAKQVVHIVEILEAGLEERDQEVNQ